ncbi:cytochrome P450 [Pseudomethylobacillus aquaticus]|uniref:Cytochrome P450 n=1 Tax=Pseudomethylobacillus aquaticus TaxID=2676064 RepID=A0A3N0V3G8_9PROT|nr:cytochrome P450 [Pseudomethylobacillus aquaticus]ROH87094.1 cytochrome P450 [Pseudomethylobacillus aquaticus]
MFRPSYPIPHKNKTSFLLRFFRGWHSWLDVLFERSYFMKMGKIRQPGLDIFMINDPNWVKRILVDEPKKYPKHALMHKMLEPLLGNSIFTTNGAVWERQRRLVDAGFGQARLKLVFPLMTSAISEMLARLDQYADGSPYEVDGEMTHITADIIFRTILSENLSDSAARGIFEAFNEFQVHAQRALMLRIYKLPTFFAERASQRAADKIRPVIADVIARRYQERAGGSSGHYQDILSGIMDAVDPVNQDSFSYEETVDQICMLFLAGHETSASALTWSLYLLSNCPHLQDRLIEEIEAVAADRPFVFEDIKQLKLINNVFKEALRLYPPVGFFSREATEDHCIRDKDIATGSSLLISPWLIQRHGDYWDKPHDFDPDRFDTAEGQESAKCAYLPFSKGPRVCIGQGFAIQEAILILANIVRRYRIAAVADHIPKAVGRVTIRPENGVKVRLESRK